MFVKVLVLGGTGSIGSAVVRTLVHREHEVIGLCRSSNSCRSLRKIGATPIEGDIRNPSQWIDVCDVVDGVVHAAAVWGSEMGDVDRQLVNAVLHRLQSGDANRAFLYTGGCWLYGETGDTVATETSAFDPLHSFAWSIPTIDKVLAANVFEGW